MAEVYLARRQDSSLAQQRLLVIKKIASASSADPEFVELFKQEVSISLGLAHPNVVQTYDYGLAEGEYFLALEYMPGLNLATLLEKLAERKVPMPLEHACHICSEVCSALAYTHSHRDPISGERRSIIHRDISPNNILVGYIGYVKLFDFGIAKIEDSKGVTRTGMIRGKPSYLSPEQALRKDLDGRSDLFSLGVVLWEMLAGSRLFVSDTSRSCIEKILSDPIAKPSELNRLVPAELDRISLKALERDKYRRHQLAQDLQRELSLFLRQRFPGYGPRDFASFLQVHLSKEIDEEERQVRAMLQADPDYPELEESGEPTVPGIHFPSTLPDTVTQTTLPMEQPPEFQRTTTRAIRPRPQAARSGPLVSRRYLIGALLLAGVGALLLKPDELRFLNRGPAKVQPQQQLFEDFDDPSKENLQLVTDKVGYTVTVDGRMADVLSGSIRVPRDRTVLVRVDLRGYEPLEWEQPAGKLDPVKLSFVKLKDKGTLHFTSTPESQVKVYQGEKLILDTESPLEWVQLPVGSYELVIENKLLSYRGQINVVIEKDKTTRITRGLRGPAH
jgi:serine/threonine protein kinase